MDIDNFYLYDQTEQAVVGIDLGRGSIKVSYKEIEYEFPSTLKFIGTENMGLQEGIKSDVYKFNDKFYTVGESDGYNSISTKGDDFIFKYAPIFIFHALKMLDIDFNAPINIGLGLSKLDWIKHKDFITLVQNIAVNNEHIQFESISVHLQGQGIFWDQYEKKSMNGILCVIDIGYHSLDFLVSIDGTYRDNLSFSAEKGVFSIIFALQKFINSTTVINATEEQAKKAFLDQYIIVFGTKINLKKEIEVIVSEYTNNLIDYIIGMKSSVISQATEVILSGGGANLFVKSQLPSNFKIGNKQTKFANARGYRIHLKNPISN